MAEVFPCPSNQRLEQFLDGRLRDEDAKQLDRHLAQCEPCLQNAIARKTKDPIVQGLRHKVQQTTGPEKASLIAWIIARLKAPAGDGKMPAPAPGQPTRPVGNSIPSAHEVPSPAPSSLPAAAASAVPINAFVPVAPAGLPPGLIHWLAPAQGPDELGRLGTYRLLKVLGKGGMGIVFLAEDQKLKRQVAVKALLPAIEMESESRQRFLHEAQATAVIENDHVVPIYHVGEERGLPYLVMPFLKGETLEKRLESGQPIPVPELLRLGRELAWGLAAAHTKGLIHRDIKPANIWLEAPSARVKILDFGLARAVGDPTKLTQTGYVVGTPAYMAPEQARGQAVDQRCDLFSLGVVLYRMGTGAYPFQGATTMALLSALAMDTPQSVTQLNPQLPREFAELVMQLLAKNPTARPQSAQEVAERIQAIEQVLASGPRNSSVKPMPSVHSALVPMAIPIDAPMGSIAELTNPCKIQDEAIFTSDTSQLKNRVRRPANRRRLWVGLVAGLAVVIPFLGLWWFHSSARTASTKEQSLPRPPVDSTKTSVPVANGGQPPVKVFLLAGQDDMAGKGAIRTLDWLGKDLQYGSLLQKIKKPDGSWVEQDHVWMYYPRENRGNKQGKLTVGFGQADDEIGPELVFGQVLGESFPNPILLIKITKGDLSLAVEGRPPSSGGSVGPFYRHMIETVRKAMINLNYHCPGYKNQGCEIGGFVWFQGWNDMIFPDRVTQYPSNLANLIRDVRRDLGVPNLPVVIGEMGVHGNQTNDEKILTFRKAQVAAVNRPEFQGNVILVKTSKYWDEKAHTLLLKGFNRATRKWSDEETQKEFELMANREEYLYLGSGKINALIGLGFGEAMKAMCATKPDV